MGSFVGADANGANIQALTGITWPTVQSGDLALILWTFQNTLTPTDPTSDTFTLVATADDPSARSRLLKRICDGTESGDISGWQCSAINRQSAVLYVVRGYSDVAGATSFAETTAGTTHDCPSIGTGDGAANGDSIIVGVSERLTSGTTNATAPTTPVTFVEHAGSEFGTGGSGGTYTGLADDGLATSQTMPFDPGTWTGHVSGGVAVTWTVALRPSGVTLDLGQATETDAALGLTATKAATLSLPTETDTALGLTSSKAAALGLPTEADEAFGMSAAKAYTFGLATETSSSLAVTFTKVAALGLANEADVAFGAEFSAAAGFTFDLASETDTALGWATSKAYTFSLAEETDTAPTVTFTKVAEWGQAQETDSALGAVSAKALALGLATETSTAFAIGAAKAFQLGLASEVDEAFRLVLSTEPLRDVIVIAQVRSDHVTGNVALTDVVAGLRSSHITGGVDVPRNMLTGSVEYVTAEVTFVGETAAGIATVTGQVKITSDDTIPSTWDNADVTERTDVNGGALLALKKLHTAGAAGEYRVWAKVSDNPEVPILKCGSFTVR